MRELQNTDSRSSHAAANIFTATLAVAAALIAVPTLAATVTSIDFKNGADASLVEIRSDGPVTFEKQENSQDRQVIIDIQGAKLSKLARQRLDTSSFISPVSLISSYQVDGASDTARVVIQLRESVSPDVSQDGDVIRISVPNRGGGDSTSSAAAAPDAPPSDTMGSSSDSSLVADEQPSSAGDNTSMLDQFQSGKATKRFSGKSITMQVRDAEVRDVLRLIGEASGFNIIVSEKVQAKMTLSLVDVPWDQALELVLQNNALGAERNNNVLRVLPLVDMASEKTAELVAKRATQASAPRMTRVFPINYAKLSDLTGLLKGMHEAKAAGVGAGAGQAAVVLSDTRTNSIVIQDIPENMEWMRKLIELLDTQTPQILIEAKVVEASENFSKSLNGSIGIGGTGRNQFFGSFNGANPLDALLGGVHDGGGAAETSAPVDGFLSGTVGISPSVSFIPGVARLNALLNLGEKESQVKIVSTPRVVVSNGEKASISQTKSIIIPTAGTASSAPSVVIIPAEIRLDIDSAIVTNDGSVILDLKLERAVPDDKAANPRRINTKVVVESGSTLVIGGLFTSNETHAQSGFPILRKIPILGALFGGESDANDRSELFFFITPRILNAKEAGLGT